MTCWIEVVMQCFATQVEGKARDDEETGTGVRVNRVQTNNIRVMVDVGTRRNQVRVTTNPVSSTDICACMPDRSSSAVPEVLEAKVCDSLQSEP